MSDKKAPPLGSLTRAVDQDDNYDEIVMTGTKVTPASTEYTPARPEMGMRPGLIEDIAGSESQPFDYTGTGAGALPIKSEAINPAKGVPNITNDGGLGDYVSNPLDRVGNANVVIQNNTPIDAFDYSSGLTTSQMNSRDFFGGLQEFRQQIAPHMLPALQFTPQQVSPAVSSGMTTEDKAPGNWLIGDVTEDLDPTKGQFGAMGGGLLGGLGWVFSRLSPTTYLKGAALDVSRSAASIIEGGSAGISSLLKDGDFGKAFNNAGTAASDNYAANSPQARGVYVKKVFGSKSLGDDLSQSYFLAAATGMTDLSFSGVGNNPLIQGDGVLRNAIKKDNFNPFGVRDGIRSNLDTGKLEEQERRLQGKGPLHGYDQWLKGIGGLGLDVLLEGRIDKLAQQAVKKATRPVLNVYKTPKITTGGVTATLQAPTTKLPLAKPTLQPVTKRVQPNTSALAELAKKPIEQQPAARKPSKVSPGQVVNVLEQRLAKMQAKSPSDLRFTQLGEVPAFLEQAKIDVRRYAPRNGLAGLDFTAGGALVPSVTKNVDAVIGVGSTPSVLPVVQESIPSTSVAPTVYSAKTQEYISSTSVPVETTTTLPTAKTKKPKKEKPVTPGKVRVNYTETEKAVPVKREVPLSKTERKAELKRLALEAKAIIRGHYTNVKKSTSLRGDTPIKSDQVADLTKLDNSPYPTTRMPSEVPSQVKGTNTPVVPSTRLVEPSSGLSGDISVVAKLAKTLPEPPPLVPKNTPNVTVTPTNLLDETVNELHDLNPANGTFSNSEELLKVQTRVPNTQVDDLPTVVSIPDAPKVNYITPEAISPSVSSADIIRRLSSGDDIEGALYNPKQVSRGERTAKQLVALGRMVVLPGGVKVIPDTIKDSSALKHSRIQQYVDTAIKTSGLNESSPEAASIRRLFDRYGKALPTNLADDFMIEVTPRTTDSPAQYIQPAKTSLAQEVSTPSEVTSLGVWTGRAASYDNPPIPMGEDYAVGIKVRYDEKTNKIVPVDGVEAKLRPVLASKNVTAAKQSSVPRVESEGVISRERLRELPVKDRQLIITKSYMDGYEVPRGAMEDAMYPDLVNDAVAARDYAREFLSKKARPIKDTPEGRQLIAKHSEQVDEVKYVNSLIDELSDELSVADEELAKLLDNIDGMDDLGVHPLTDEVPPSSLPPMREGATPPKFEDAVKVTGTLYHGTRVNDLLISSVNPLEGATRSEFGTGVWLTNNKDIALSASGREVPNNVEPGVARTFTDDSFVHELPEGSLDNMNILNSTARLTKAQYQHLAEEASWFDFSNLEYEELLRENLTELIYGNKNTVGEIFSGIDSAVQRAAMETNSVPATELEMTYIQRLYSDLLNGMGIEGITNGTNTAVFNTKQLTTSYVHEVSDLVGDTTDLITVATHNVNLLEQSYKLEPGNKLLKVQLAEAKAVLVSRLRDRLADEVDELEALKTKEVSDVLDTDDALEELTRKQREEEAIQQQLRDEDMYEFYSREFNDDMPWFGECV